MLSGIKQQAVVGKGGKIEIQTSELTEGTVVEVIVLVEQDATETDASQSTLQDETEYLLSTEANRHRLMTAIQNVETKNNLISFTPEESEILYQGQEALH
jgi:antitoxin YefM